MAFPPMFRRLGYRVFSLERRQCPCLSFSRKPDWGEAIGGRWDADYAIVEDKEDHTCNESNRSGAKLFISLKSRESQPPIPFAVSCNTTINQQLATRRADQGNTIQVHPTKFSRCYWLEFLRYDEQNNSEKETYQSRTTRQIHGTSPQPTEPAAIQAHRLLQLSRKGSHGR